MLFIKRINKKEGEVMNKLISVIIPIYNSENYMKKCIESIIHQTYKNLEIILVNDGSKDKSLEKCEYYKRIDKRVVVVNKKNGGAASARNKGIDICKGSYISFIDSDDWIDLDTFEVLSREFCNDYDIIIFNSITECNNNQTINNKGSKRKYIMDSKEAIIKMNSYTGITNSQCDKLFKKELFDKLRFPEGTICEDYYIMPKLFSKSKKILYLPIWKYHYFVRENSTSRVSKINYEYVKASKEQKQLIDHKYSSISYIGNTAYVFSNILIYNSYILNDVELNFDTKKKIHDDLKMYRKDIIANKYLPLKKKIQALLYLGNLKIYNKLILKIKKK